MPSMKSLFSIGSMMGNRTHSLKMYCILLLSLVAINYASALVKREAQTLGMMRYGRANPTLGMMRYGRANPTLGMMRYGKRDSADFADDFEKRQPLGLLRYGRAGQQPLGMMRYGRSGAHSLGMMRYGRAEARQIRNLPGANMRFGKK